MQPIQKQGPLKIDFKADCTRESKPTAWEIRLPENLCVISVFLSIFDEINRNKKSFFEIFGQVQN